MNKICVINSYNYERYLEECILSVLNQTVQFDKIFIIDDGSTDGSVDLIYSYAKAHKSIEVIAKENAGQLSCFNVVVDKIENDDLV
jgi:glycosyltransferase involved in cell wall biosynthesis